MKPFTFDTAHSIVFGAGVSGRIGELALQRLCGPASGEAASDGANARVLLVTDQGVVAAHLLDPALRSLRAAGLATEVFDGVVADPPEAVVLAAVAQARAMRATAVIGFGGGSPMDTAKLVALLARTGAALGDIYGVGKAVGPRLPLMLVPTTAGTGSEVTPVAVVTTGAREKQGVVSPLLLPDVALLDPELTYGLPHHVTAATGVDAMVHAIEAHESLNPNNNPLSRLLAREALRLLGDGIRSAVREGTHPEARCQMMLGAMLAGQAFANSPVAAVHALAYPVGAHFHVAHGLSNALVLPHVLRFNCETDGGAYAGVAPALFPFLTGTPASRRGLALADALAHLIEEIGLPTRLRDVAAGNGNRIGREALPGLARDAMKQTRLLVNNPRPLSEADALGIYEAAW